MNPLAQRALLAVVPPLAHAWLRVLGATMRVSVEGGEAFQAVRARGRYILAFWHARFLMMPWSYPDGRIVVLVSRHRDAEMLVRTLRGFGLAFARGSTTEGGAAGLRALLRYVEDGHDVGVAPDGPRGPRRRVQPGVVLVARLSGLPIVPVGFSARPSSRLRSWDRTLLPRPFARGVFVYGAPLTVDRRADAAAQEAARVTLEAELDRVTDRADTLAGIPLEEARPPA
ncbi:MAG TPA: lysophospholipid acyltransferase family protein [Candidatus Polarisedimenticolaceae bacterium]|nr:lysophospholipid acyltransferase family protein [Candidatus Polarisedimenticolaceae bacterium]